MPRCKEGDLVLVVNANIKENIGKHAVVKELVGVFGGNTMWLCETSEPWKAKCILPGEGIVLTRLACIRDSWLIPIKGPSVDESQFKEETHDEGLGVSHYSGCEIVR